MARRFTDASALVASLLDRHEAKPHARRLLAYVDYPGFRSIDGQDDCVAELHALERAGGIILKPERVDGVARIAYVRLADAAVLYRHLGRSPASRLAAEALAPLRRRAALSEPLSSLLDEVQERWSRNVTWNTLALGEGEALAEAVDLAAALAARADTAAAPIDYRTFSRETVGDSKSLETLITVVAALLRRLFPGAIAEPDLEAEDVLASLGVTRLPQPFLVSGAVTLDGHTFPDMPYVGVPPEIAHRLMPARPVDYLLTVENYTSFVRHAVEVNAGKTGIVVYTGGFPARVCLAAIAELATRAGAPVFHWGDIDPGGLRIFVHLERTLQERGLILKPHLMSTEILRKHGRPGDRPNRRLQPAKARNSALVSLWDMMAADTAALELEQEALHPTAPFFD